MEIQCVRAALWGHSSCRQEDIFHQRWCHCCIVLQCIYTWHSTLAMRQGGPPFLSKNLSRTHSSWHTPRSINITRSQADLQTAPSEGRPSQVIHPVHSEVKAKPVEAYRLSHFRKVCVRWPAEKKILKCSLTQFMLNVTLRQRDVQQIYCLQMTNKYSLRH